MELCKNLGIHNHFISVEHPQANRQAESANKVILLVMKKKLDDAKGIWADYLQELLWSYHTTPQSTTKETPFRMVYGSDAMTLVEIELPTWRMKHFDEGTNNEGLEIEVDLVDEVRATAQIREVALKQRMERRFKSKLRPRSFKVGNSVLKKVIESKHRGKLAPNWEGLYKIKEVHNNVAYMW